MIKLQIPYFLKISSLADQNKINIYVLKFILSLTFYNYFEACQNKLSSLYRNTYLFQINWRKRHSGGQDFYIRGTKEKRP